MSFYDLRNEMSHCAAYGVQLNDIAATTVRLGVDKNVPRGSDKANTFIMELTV